MFRLVAYLLMTITPADYPDTRRDESVSDEYHGTAVADPYRWLEDTESDETADWIAAQKAVTDAYLASLPSRQRYVDRLTELWNYERYGLPRRHGDVYLYRHNDGLQDQSVLYTAASLDGDRTPLLDPNTLSDDGTVALAATSVDDDGVHVAYSLADGGSDWRTIKIRRLTDGQDLDDVVRWVKFSSIEWSPDGDGFYYGRYDAPSEEAELLATNENQRLYFHRIGDNQSDDTLVIERPDEPQWGFSPAVTDDGRHLVIGVWKGTDPKTQLFVQRLDAPEATAPIDEVITGFDADYTFVAADADTLFILTDNDAPRRRLIAVDLDRPQREHWRTVIPQSNDVLESVALFGDTFYATYLVDAKSAVRKFTIDGEPAGELALPGVGSVSGFAGDRNADETFYTFQNYTTPATIYRLNLSDGETSVWRSPDVPLNTDAFVTEQIFATSPDGTRVPVTVTRRRDTPTDGTVRTILYGYGGFNISILPRYSPAVAGWIDGGGTYAVATLRGGGEYGAEWHESGMRLSKTNVFDDCVAAAETLIDRGYCSADTLCLSGRSNGGLLVGAVMTRRPDLLGAALPAVGVLDMLRYHQFTIGWAWAGEYGRSDESEQFPNLLSYSPLHNLRPGVCYPATMVITADRDDRVVPGHSFKFAAQLQHVIADTPDCDRPMLIRIETRAGHGAGTPVTKQIEEYADAWAFAEANTTVAPK